MPADCLECEVVGDRGFGTGLTHATTPTLTDATTAVAEVVLKALVQSRVLPRRSIWLFVAHDAWQYRSAMVSHKRLWRSLEIESAVPPKFIKQRSSEVLRASEDGVRYAGLLELSPQGLVPAANFTRCLHSSVLFLSERTDLASTDVVSDMFACAFPVRKGVPDGRVDWGRISLGAYRERDILLKVTGGFDDPDISMHVIGSGTVIHAIKQSISDVHE